MGEIYKNGGGYANQSYAEKHELTGLYYNNSFFKMVDEKKKWISKQTYMMVALDIEHFKLFNKLYGRKEGDKLLVYISEKTKKRTAELYTSFYIAPLFLKEQPYLTH